MPKDTDNIFVVSSVANIRYEAIPTEDGWVLLVSGVSPQAWSDLPRQAREAILHQAQRLYSLTEGIDDEGSPF